VAGGLSDDVLEFPAAIAFAFGRQTSG
jgi:hypothetical protein